MSGDSRISVSGRGSFLGIANQINAIDGHSMRSGDFTEARVVEGKQIFLTPEGASGYDNLLADPMGLKLRVEQDPGRLSKALLGDIKEHFTGRP